MAHRRFGMKFTLVYERGREKTGLEWMLYMDITMYQYHRYQVRALEGETHFMRTLPARS